mmetsp:Transcript_5726/g.17012  ORF Transcript_5726/g.17012 Transcript_5726/m.17012 type:complete len:106 (-) Transcript_5726:1023-1340(-)
MRVVGEGAEHAVFRRDGEPVVWRLSKKRQIFAQTAVRFEKWVARVGACTPSLLRTKLCRTGLATNLCLAHVCARCQRWLLQVVKAATAGLTFGNQIISVRPALVF